MNRDQANAARFDPSSEAGHYESWFIRANSAGGEAFWIRYTLFHPAGGGKTLGERWAIVFRPEHPEESKRIVAVKDDVAMSQCGFSAANLNARIAESTLSDAGAEGECSRGGHKMSWNLAMKGGDEPLLLLQPGLYKGGFPKAKALVPRPHVVFDGEILIDGEALRVDAWRGSQNHNWGSRHTDRYAWGQVVSFEERDDAFLEVSTAQIDLGPFRSPWFTPLTLRLGGETYNVGSLVGAARNHGDYGAGRDGTPGTPEHPHWSFGAVRRGFSIQGRIEAPASAFVALPYSNPPGGEKICLNTKCARCVLEVRIEGKHQPLTSSAAAFEMLCDVRPSTIPHAFE